MGRRSKEINKKKHIFCHYTYFDIIADVARLSKSYPPSEPDMADADQSVAADLPRRCQVPTTVHDNSRRGPSAPESVDGGRFLLLTLILSNIRCDTPFPWRLSWTRSASGLSVSNQVIKLRSCRTRGGYSGRGGSMICRCVFRCVCVCVNVGVRKVLE